LQNNGSKKMEQKQREEKKRVAAISAIAFHTLSGCSMLDPHAGVRLVGRPLLVFLEAPLVDTSPVLPWTPVLPDEFIVTGDAVLASVCVERRAAASSEHTRV
jgi:hypothetical protein